MSLSPLQFDTLNEIGVTLWERRPQRIEQTTVAEPTLLTNGVPMQPCWFFMPSAVDSESEKRLLTAMLRAINLDWQSVALLRHEQLDLLEQSLADGHNALIFADHSAQINITGLDFVADFVKSIGNARVALTYTLPELLKQPALKQHVWQRLKSLRQNLV